MGVQSIDIPCDACGELGRDAAGRQCKECNGLGHWSIDQCPHRWIGARLTQEINLATYAIRGMLPIAGGMLDQSHWFVDLMRTLENETNKIEAMQIEQARNRR